MSDCEPKIYLHLELTKVLGCPKSALTWAVQKSGDEFTLRGVKLRRIPHTIPGTASKWGYIILGEAPDAGEAGDIAARRVHRTKPKDGHCVGCEVKVGVYRAIRLNGKTVCQTCHQAAFIKHDVDMRRTLGVV